jgi:hypothetical protein
VKITLHSMHCHAKTETDEDEIYCVVTTGDSQHLQLARVDIGKFEIGRDLRPDQLIWSGTNALVVQITFMESDADEPEHGSDDFIGEVTISLDGTCKPGHATLDEGYDAGNRYRQFSMTGSAAHYVVQLQIQP